MNSKAQKEKRYYPRIKEDFQMRVIYASDEYQAEINDISIRGISFFFEQELSVGTMIELKIDSDQKFSAIVLLAEVLRIEPVKDCFLIACKLTVPIPDTYLMDTFALINRGEAKHT